MDPGEDLRGRCLISPGQRFRRGWFAVADRASLFESSVELRQRSVRGDNRLGLA